ncbi:hypothetical protein HK097_011150 [Rhizophlyctis rosea]|uniref:Uncharacterized protein n=1 Tax=Rhizophlyctis rosea TaxID=64517 RepID=A0AAD5S6R2_9FUNG|nr:hypothetical protein HK097_011150 [Rhizophlyctis rosea]
MTPTVHLHFSVETEFGNEIGTVEAGKSEITLSFLRISAPGTYDLQEWNCFIRAGDGPHTKYGYLKVLEEPMLQFALDHFNASAYFVTFHESDQPSPNRTPIISTPHTPRDQSASSTPKSKGKRSTPVDPDVVASAIAALNVSKPSNQIDPFSQEDVTELGSRRIMIKNGPTVIAVDGEYLLEFVKSLSLFIDMCSNLKKYSDALKDFHKSPLWMKVKLYLSDLLRFGSDQDARNRLETDFTAKFYLTNVYFTTDEVNFLLSFPSGSGLTFEQVLEVLMKDKMNQSRAGNSRDFDLCTSHDLAPVVRDVFGIRKGFEEEKIFISASKAFQKEWKAKAKRNK